MKALEQGSARLRRLITDTEQAKAPPERPPNPEVEEFAPGAFPGCG
jgi:hypothetical protein